MFYGTISQEEKEVQRSNLGVNLKQLLEHQTFSHSATKFNNSKTLTFYIYGSKMFATWCHSPFDVIYTPNFRLMKARSDIYLTSFASVLFHE